MLSIEAGKNEETTTGTLRIRASWKGQIGGGKKREKIPRRK